MSAAAPYTQQLKILEDMFVVRVYSKIAYQHDDDDEFASTVNVINIKINSQEQVYCLHMFIYIKGKITEIIRAQV